MANTVTNIGEEYLTENDIGANSLTIGIYNDSTDGVGEATTLSGITSEPSGASYNRQSVSVTSKQIGSDFGIENDAGFTFDVSDSSETVDHFLVVVNFQSDTVAGDSSAQDHLIGVAPLTGSRDLTDIDETTFDASDLSLKIQ